MGLIRHVGWEQGRLQDKGWLWGLHQGRAGSWVSLQAGLALGLASASGCGLMLGSG